jgi:hypothetical protein
MRLTFESSGPSTFNTAIFFS